MPEGGGWFVLVGSYLFCLVLFDSQTAIGGREVAAIPSAKEAARIEADDGAKVGIVVLHQIGHLLTGDIGVWGNLCKAGVRGEKKEQKGTRENPKAISHSKDLVG
jgi:hypothetical protein